MNLIPLKLLYWGKDEKSCERVSKHHHDFCQLEFCRQGQRVCRAGQKEEIINAAEAVFIPVGLKHGFYTSEHKACSYFSFKFRLPDNTGILLKFQKIPEDFFTRYVLRQMEAILCPSEGGAGHRQFPTRELLAMLLAGLLEHMLNTAPPDEEHGILQFMRSKVIQYGATLNVKMVADGLNLTVPQLRYRFRQAMKSLPPGAVRYDNPGDFLKAEVMNMAQNHLRTTKLSVGEIAKLLKFNNVYTFSRFFKHLCGVSPRPYRNHFAAGGVSAAAPARTSGASGLRN